MARFLFTYHGGKKPENPEAAEAVMAQWGAWLGGLGAAVLDAGGPAGMSKMVTVGGVANDGGANSVSGHTIVEADNQDAAVEMAKGCPILDGGSVEVTEILQM